MNISEISYEIIDNPIRKEKQEGKTKRGDKTKQQEGLLEILVKKVDALFPFGLP